MSANPSSVVEASSGNQETFEVELTKGQQGLGITIAGYICEKSSGSGKL